MKSKNVMMTIGSAVLGAGLIMGTAAYANHGHTGNNTTTGMGMMGNTTQNNQQTPGGHMGNTSQNNQQTPGGHMGTVSGGHMGTSVTTAANHHDIQRAGKTGNFQNHMNGPAGNTANQHHGTTDHHNSITGK